MTSPGTLTVEQVTPESWTAIAAGFTDHNYEQSRSYAEAMARKGGAKALFQTVHDGREILGAAAVRLKAVPLLGRGAAYITGGPLIVKQGYRIDHDRRTKVLGALRNHYVDHQGHGLFLRPALSPAEVSTEQVEAEIIELGFRPTQRFRSYRTMAVDLSPDEQELRRSLAGKWRTDLNFANRAGFTVETGGPELAERFMRLFGDMHDAKNFDVHVDPRNVFSLPPEETGLVVLIATKDNKDAAGHVLSLLGDTAVYLFGATNELGRSGKAGYLLNWQAMLISRQRGFKWYDLGGIDPDTNPGGHRFKKRLGGRDLKVPGPYEALPSSLSGKLLDALLDLRGTYHAARKRLWCLA